MPRARKFPTPAIFYGYPVELIRDWCAVSRQTAYLYKIGARKPSRQALRLFTMHRDGRILGGDWDGWRVEKGCIFDPSGTATSVRQLRAYGLMMQFVHELARRSPADRDKFYEILRSA